MGIRVALITGATDGIGKATARSLLRANWSIVITGRSPEKCKNTIDELEVEFPNSKVSYLVADLSQMSDVKRLASEFSADHDHLDLLLLNANSITQDHVRTKDGFEANFAIGYLGRTLLTWQLEPLLKKAQNPQVVHVVGLNLERINFDDPSTPEGFSSMKALGRWQWAVQVFSREYNRRVPSVAVNIYMPGLVKTKILANEPQPMRLFVQLANVFIGVPVPKAGDELASVIDELFSNNLRDSYYARKERKPARDLKDLPGDGAKLWALTQRLLTPWLAP